MFLVWETTIHVFAKCSFQPKTSILNTDSVPLLSFLPRSSKRNTDSVLLLKRVCNVAFCCLGVVIDALSCTTVNVVGVGKDYSWFC